jgi:hypothetical protein
VIDAPIERVYPLIRELDLKYSILSPLFRLGQRAAGRLSPGKKREGGSDLSLQSFLDSGFVLLAEHPPQEVVIKSTTQSAGEIGRN